MPGIFELPATISPVVRVDVEQHRALEAVMLGQNARQLRQRFLRAIFMIARQKDNVLAFSWACGPFIDQRCGDADTRKSKHQAN